MLNLKTKRKGIVIGALSALIISGSLVSINVFAETNKTDVKPLTNKTDVKPLTNTTSQVVLLYKGKAKDIPENLRNSNKNLMEAHPNDFVFVIEKSN
jgi:hypothetical protein